MTSVDLTKLVVPSGGDARGYNQESDVARVTQTADGVDLNTLWDEVTAILDTWNSERTAIGQLLTYKTTLAA